MPAEDDDTTDEQMPERPIGRDAATPGGHQNRRATRRVGKSENAKVGMGFFSEGTTLPKEAELAWPIILDQIEANGMSPYDASIQVVQLDPPTAAGNTLSIGAPISGGAVQGNNEEPPGAALVRYVTKWYHMPRASSKSTVKYQLRFTVGRNSIARAELVLASREEIMALDRADQMRRAAGGEQPPPYMPPPSFMAPSSSVPSAAGVGMPMQQPQMSTSAPSMMEMWQMMREMMSAGQQVSPQMMDLMARVGMGSQPPPVTAPPPLDEAAMAERVTANVVKTLAQLGVITIPKPYAVGVAPVAQATVVAPVAGVAAAPIAPKSAMERAFERVMDAAVTQFVGGVERSIKATITGVGAPPVESAAEEAPEVEKPPVLPWKSMPVPGATWGNGSQVNYAEDTETGGISLQGFAMNNPILLEKGFEVVTGLAGAATEALKKITMPKQKTPQTPQMPPTPSSPQIVSEIPAAAADGTPEPSDWK
jgi:hypothetical protein